MSRPVRFMSPVAVGPARIQVAGRVAKWSAGMASRSCVLLCVAGLVSPAQAHGYLTVPAARNTLWHSCPESRATPYNQPANYDRTSLAAGGPGWVSEHGHGACGDKAGEEPPAHETAGRFANGFVAARYRSASTVRITVTITAHHKGYFGMQHVLLYGILLGASHGMRICMVRSMVCVL